MQEFSEFSALQGFMQQLFQTFIAFTFGNVKHVGNGSQAFHKGGNQADFRFLIHQLEPPSTYGDVVRACKVPNDSSRRTDTHVADDREEPPTKVANKTSMSQMSHPNHIHVRRLLE